MKKIIVFGAILMFILPILFNNCFGGVRIKSPVEKSYKVLNDSQLVIIEDTLKFDYIHYGFDNKEYVDTFIFINNEFAERLRDCNGYYYGNKNYHYRYFPSNKFPMSITVTKSLIIIELIHNDKQYLFRVFENENGTIDKGCVNAYFNSNLAYYVVDLSDIDERLIRFYDTSGKMIYYADVVEVSNQSIYDNNFR